MLGCVEFSKPPKPKYSFLMMLISPIFSLIPNNGFRLKRHPPDLSAAPGYIEFCAAAQKVIHAEPLMHS